MTPLSGERNSAAVKALASAQQLKPVHQHATLDPVVQNLRERNLKRICLYKIFEKHTNIVN